MIQSLQLGPSTNGDDRQNMRRLNRLPILIAVVITVVFFGVVFVGLSWRGLASNQNGDLGAASKTPATNFGDQLKKGISDGIIGEPEKQDVFQPAPAGAAKAQIPEPLNEQRPMQYEERSRRESEAEWRARLKREQDEQYIREAHRQRMARLQARATALDSPLKVDVSTAEKTVAENTISARRQKDVSANSTSDLYTAAMQSGLFSQNGDPNGQASKEAFFNQDIQELGYLPNRVVPPMSPYELKRGSVIPATLISGLNSDLPGRIIAQVSQNVYDSATGYRLLIPQGAKVFGRYDSRVSFGQERVLVVWTDLIFPNGSTLQIGGMAGSDGEGYGGFSDKLDRHLWRTFASAALVAIIGTGIDMSLPESSTLATQDTATDAARRNFAEVFGRAAEQTISRNLNIQPTVRVRPGYKFNILVDQDIVFPNSAPH